MRIVVGDLPFDVPVLKDLRAWLDARGVGPRDPLIADEPASSVGDVVGQLSGADLVVASRFHNVLLALLLGKPVLSISYNAKNDALMRDVGCADYCQTLDGLDLERLKEQFGDLERAADRLRREIPIRVAVFRERLEYQYRALFALLAPAWMERQEVHDADPASRIVRWRDANWPAGRRILNISGHDIPLAWSA